MFRKLTLVVAAGAGYVLGARAGKERYAQLEAKARQLANKPAVKNATDTVLAKAEDVKDSAAATALDVKQTLNDKVESVADRQGSQDAEDTMVDLSAPLAGAAPMAGAAPSATAPDTP